MRHGHTDRADFRSPPSKDGGMLRALTLESTERANSQLRSAAPGSRLVGKQRRSVEKPAFRIQELLSSTWGFKSLSKRTALQTSARCPSKCRRRSGSDGNSRNFRFGSKTLREAPNALSRGEGSGVRWDRIGAFSLLRMKQQQSASKEEGQSTPASSRSGRSSCVKSAEGRRVRLWRSDVASDATSMPSSATRCFGAASILNDRFVSGESEKSQGTTRRRQASSVRRQSRVRFSASTDLTDSALTLNRSRRTCSSCIKDWKGKSPVSHFPPATSASVSTAPSSSVCATKTSACASSASGTNPPTVSFSESQTCSSVAQLVRPSSTCGAASSVRSAGSRHLTATMASKSASRMATEPSSSSCLLSSASLPLSNFASPEEVVGSSSGGVLSSSLSRPSMSVTRGGLESATCSSSSTSSSSSSSPSPSPPSLSSPVDVAEASLAVTRAAAVARAAAAVAVSAQAEVEAAANAAIASSSSSSASVLPSRSSSSSPDDPRLKQLLLVLRLVLLLPADLQHALQLRLMMLQQSRTKRSRKSASGTSRGASEGRDVADGGRKGKRGGKVKATCTSASLALQTGPEVRLGSACQCFVGCAESSKAASAVGNLKLNPSLPTRAATVSSLLHSASLQASAAINEGLSDSSDDNVCDDEETEEMGRKDEARQRTLLPHLPQTPRHGEETRRAIAEDEESADVEERPSEQLQEEGRNANDADAEAANQECQEGDKRKRALSALLSRNSITSEEPDEEELFAKVASSRNASLALCEGPTASSTFIPFSAGLNSCKSREFLSASQWRCARGTTSACQWSATACQGGFASRRLSAATILGRRSSMTFEKLLLRSDASVSRSALPVVHRPTVRSPCSFSRLSFPAPPSQDWKAQRMFSHRFPPSASPLVETREATCYPFSDLSVSTSDYCCASLSELRRRCVEASACSSSLNCEMNGGSVLEVELEREGGTASLSSARASPLKSHASPFLFNRDSSPVGSYFLCPCAACRCLLVRGKSPLAVGYVSAWDSCCRLSKACDALHASRSVECPSAALTSSSALMLSCRKGAVADCFSKDFFCARTVAMRRETSLEGATNMERMTSASCAGRSSISQRVRCLCRHFSSGDPTAESSRKAETLLGKESSSCSCVNQRDSTSLPRATPSSLPTLRSNESANVCRHCQDSCASSRTCCRSPCLTLEIQSAMLHGGTGLDDSSNTLSSLSRDSASGSASVPLLQSSEATQPPVQTPAFPAALTSASSKASPFTSKRRRDSEGKTQSCEATFAVSLSVPQLVVECPFEEKTQAPGDEAEDSLEKRGEVTTSDKTDNAQQSQARLASVPGCLGKGAKPELKVETEKGFNAREQEELRKARLDLSDFRWAGSGLCGDAENLGISSSEKLLHSPRETVSESESVVSSAAPTELECTDPAEALVFSSPSNVCPVLASQSEGLSRRTLVSGRSDICMGEGGHCAECLEAETDTEDIAISDSIQKRRAAQHVACMVQRSDLHSTALPPQPLHHHSHRQQSKQQQHQQSHLPQSVVCVRRFDSSGYFSQLPNGATICSQQTGRGACGFHFVRNTPVSSSSSSRRRSGAADLSEDNNAPSAKERRSSVSALVAEVSSKEPREEGGAAKLEATVGCCADCPCGGASRQQQTQASFSSGKGIGISLCRHRKGRPPPQLLHALMERVAVDSPLSANCLRQNSSGGITGTARKNCDSRSCVAGTEGACWSNSQNPGVFWTFAEAPSTSARSRSGLGFCSKESRAFLQSSEGTLVNPSGASCAARDVSAKGSLNSGDSASSEQCVL